MRPTATAGNLAGVAAAQLRTQPDQHIVLAGGGQVGGRIGVFQNQVQVAAAQSLFQRGNLHRPLQFDGDREGVAVKDWRMNHLQRQCGPAAG